MQFFSTTDTGETSNRFSQDLELIDMELPLAIIGTTVALLSCIGQLVVICVGSKFVGAIIPGLLVILYFVQRFYLRTSRQLRILDIEAKAPLLSHFMETIHGSVGIRAFGWTKEYRDKNEKILKNSQRPYYLLYCCQRWLNLVLDLLVAVIAIVLMSIVVSTRDTTGALIGLALANKLI
jgi:ATP-binding cassette subfamily C (CFTR/MRP) protein 1